jgi:hypothetical protein
VIVSPLTANSGLSSASIAPPFGTPTVKARPLPEPPVFAMFSCQVLGSASSCGLFGGASSAVSFVR